MVKLKRRYQRLKVWLCNLLYSLALTLTASSLAFETLIPNPQPFRGYEFDGRVYDLEHYGLLHRFSYLPDDTWTRDWQSGLITSVGSVTSKDFYSLLYFNQSWQFNSDWQFELRSERGEDFDNRYSSTQLGVSYQLSEFWRVTVLSQLQAVKQNEDLQLELTYQPSHLTQARVALVATDWVFNKKQRQGEYYSRQPYTLFAEIQQQLTPQHSISGYLNYNLPLTLTREDPTLFDDNASRLEYENSSAEINWHYQLSSNIVTRVSVHQEQGTRERFRPMQYGLFERDYLTALFEVTLYHNLRRQYWLGVRYLKFDEHNNFFDSDDRADQWHRRGSMIYGGIDYYLDSGWVFSPTLFIEAIDHQKTIIAGSGTGPEFDETLIKLSLPFRYQFDDRLQLIVNPTYEVDQNNFGGLNIQLLIPF